MAEQHTLRVIARIHSDFPTKFGIPRQSGLVEALRAAVVFEPEYRNPDALRGLEGFSHLWLIWQFSQAVRESWSPTVRPPRLGGMDIPEQDSPYVAVVDAYGRIVSTAPYSRRVRIGHLAKGLYEIRTLAKKGRSKHIGYFIK